MELIMDAIMLVKDNIQITYKLHIICEGIIM